MKIHHSPSPSETKVLGTQQLRDAFLIESLFQGP
jgi:5-keto 4-deoxyuronate isomerase